MKLSRTILCRSALVLLAVESFLRRFDCSNIVHCPARKTADRLLKRTTKFGQLIIDAWRDCRRDGAAYKSVTLEVAQGERQHALRNARNLTAKFIEAAWTFGKRLDHEDRPFVPNPLEKTADRAANRAVRIFHGLPLCFHSTNLFA